MIKQEPKSIVLFDIDYTLFDQDSYRDRFFPLLGKEIGITDKDKFLSLKKATDEKTRKIAGFFDPYVFLGELIKHAQKPTTLKRLENIFFNNDIYKTSLYEDTLSVLNQMTKKKYVVGILSTGHTKHQKKKIEQLKEYFRRTNIHIFPNKIAFLKEVLEKYKTHKEIYLVDDTLEVLNAAKAINGNLNTIWIKKTKKYEAPFSIPNFNPDYTFTNLSAILSILRK